jgi:hypothetical protein
MVYLNNKIDLNKDANNEKITTYMEMEQTKKTKQTKGVNRNTIDKYYTKNTVVESCVELVKKYIQINSSELIIEPSAGNGSFISAIKGLTDNHAFYDLEPENEEIVKQNVFIKFAPILDPFKYMIGKYNKISDFTLPNINQVEKKSAIDDKINDCNNSAYVDGLFSFLSSKLLNDYNFVHGIDFFGSFVGIKNNFKLNIADDLEYLIKY